VYVDYRTPRQQPLQRVTAAQLRSYAKAGQFPPGSMGPKVDAVMRFVENGGGRAVITSPEHLYEAVQGRAGTEILPG
jgi:carbamate kinase